MTTTADAITTLHFYPKRSAVRRYFALWYFTSLLIVWNILGHVFLGFEQSHIQPLVGLATAISLQFLLEWIDVRASDRKPRFAGSWADLVNFLPPAIIPGLAVTMLLYPNERLMPVIFGVGVAICSKVIFRAPVGDGKTQHIFNPSNLGIVATLLLFPSIGVAPPYHFTENLTGMWHWAAARRRAGDGLDRPWAVHGPIDDGSDVVGCVHHPGSAAELVFRDALDRAPDADDKCGVHGIYPVHDP